MRQVVFIIRNWVKIVQKYRTLYVKIWARPIVAAVNISL